MTRPEPPVSKGWRSQATRLVRRLEIDRAVLFVLAVRFWQLAAGPVTILVIATGLSKDTQGFFYTFGSLTALQSFIELGLHSVLFNLFGHAWAGLSWDPAQATLVGRKPAIEKLRGLDRFAGRWYSGAALLLIVVVGLIGEAFFSRAEAASVHWRLPWWALVVLTGASLRIMPSVTLLEGCGHVSVVNRYRFYQAVAGSLVVWSLILSGAGLWACAAAGGVKLLGEVVLTRVRFRTFLAAIRLPGAFADLDWRYEVWPLQWRAGLQGLFIYFSSALFIPIVFYYRGPEEAGRLGMTWGILSTFQSAAFGWAQTRIPQLTRLSAVADEEAFDRLWWRVTLASLGALAAGAAALVIAVSGLEAVTNMSSMSSLVGSSIQDVASKLGERLLPVPETMLFAAGVVFWHIFACETVYGRAHRSEPFVMVTLIANLMIGTAAWLLGRRYGSFGVGAAYLAIVALLLVPSATFVWRGFRAGRRVRGSTLDSAGINEASDG